MGLAAPFIVIGHRGAAGLEPENTLRSFRRALELGVDAIELDVHVLDGTLIVIHDERLDRTTNGRGRLGALSLARLRALDAGHGEQVPLLKDVLDLVAGHGNGRCAVNIELKGERTAAPVARIVADHPGLELLVSSFDHRTLGRFHELAPGTLVAPLFNRPHKRLLEIAATLSAWGVNISRRIASPALIANIRRRGYRCLVYTVNDISEARRLHRAGASGVFTDFPDRIVSHWHP